MDCRDVVSVPTRRSSDLRMPSTEMRLVHQKCLATIGVVGNEEHELKSLGKAGANRWAGRRPKVRGEVMNRSEEHTSELQSLAYLVCRLLLDNKKPHPS